MARWTFEPGHTAAEFKARHMMVTWVRGHFANIHGTLQFDPEAPGQSKVDIEIDVRTLWSGEPQRDEHLLGADFLDVANHPKMIFKSTKVEQLGESDYKVLGELTLRGVTRETTLDVHFLGRRLEQTNRPTLDIPVGRTLALQNDERGPFVRAEDQPAVEGRHCAHVDRAFVPGKCNVWKLLPWGHGS